LAIGDWHSGVLAHSTSQQVSPIKGNPLLGHTVTLIRQTKRWGE
jgi:hypothetical protein